MTFTLYEPLQTTRNNSATRRVHVAVKKRYMMMIVLVLRQDQKMKRYRSRERGQIKKRRSW